MCGFLHGEPDAQNEQCFDQASILRVLERRWKAAQPFDMTKVRRIVFSSAFPYHHLRQCREPMPGSHMMHHTQYRYHLVNGRNASSPPLLPTSDGAPIRLRVINSAAASNYALDFGGALSATLVAVDGQPVHPRPVSRFWLGPAQRADFLLRVPSGADPLAPALYPVLVLTEGPHVGAYAAAVVASLPAATAPAALADLQRTGTSADTQLAAAAAAAVASAAAAAAPAGMVTAAMAAQETPLRAVYPLAPRPADRWLEVNLTGENGFAGINGRSYAMPMVGEVFVPNPHPLLVRAGERVCIRFRNMDVDAHPMHVRLPPSPSFTALI
jgi:FtsP/CotA-like multicopper oxidase with cupredoxin domain